MKKRTFVIISAITICISTINANETYTKIAKSLDIYNAVLRELAINYVDTIDYEKINQAGIDYMLHKLDPYTTFFPESNKEDLKMMTTGSYGGIGSIIAQMGDSIVISEPYEGMPAQRHDVRAGDIILEVDGKSTKGLKTADVSQLLRGPQGTEVELRLKRLGEKKTLHKKFVREVIQINPVTYACMLNDTIGYIALQEFTDKAIDEFRNTLLDLSKKNDLRKLIIDLRNNGGGLISQAVDIASLFVPKHTLIVSTKGLEEKNLYEYKTEREPLFPNLPLMVMINSVSASSAEILAGALQDIDRAVIVGERSYGKGLVQSVRPLPHNTFLKVTTSKYYIPSGRCVQAIDYAKRNSDGSIQRVPDSLTHEFSTRNGRKVRDGGGITPDVTFEQRDKVNIAYYLYLKNIFFDYATQFALKHQNIAAPETFNFSDEEYANFTDYVLKRDFTYELQSAKVVNEIRDLAKTEGYAEDIDSLLTQLGKVLTPNVERDLQRFRDDVEHFLGSEIVKRYYFQKGVAAYELRYDEWLKQAIELFKNDKEYNKILNTTI